MLCYICFGLKKNVDAVSKSIFKQIINAQFLIIKFILGMRRYLVTKNNHNWYLSYKESQNMERKSQNLSQSNKGIASSI